MNELYPPGPSNVPDSLTKPARSYRLQAWLAVVGLVGFVALYLFLCAWFLRTAYRNLVGMTAGGDKALLGLLTGGVAALLAVFLIKALLGVTRGQRTASIEVSAESEPELFRFLNRLADETGAPRPHRVFLSPAVNAAVFYDLSLANLLFPSKKNLEIGLGLVNALTLSDFKAVLAHEFGHFAQRSMAVGRWVYLAQQIAGHIVARRDWFDRVLAVISSIDLRIAWIGWLVRLIVWSVRSVLDTAFTLVLLAQRALSREMEFHADLISVSACGSDALVHALHRLGAADQALDRALEIAAVEHGKGRAVSDLFAIQSRVSEHMRLILADGSHDAPPALPESEPASHRIFEEKLAQAPRMWASHPSNREREDHAKRCYLPAGLDSRSAWELFDQPEALRRRVTHAALASLEARGEVKPSTPEEDLAAVDQRFKSPALDQRYRGAYLGRSVVVDFEKLSDLYGPTPPPESIAEALGKLYPPWLAERLARWRTLEEELASLEALHEGFLTAPGGVIRHRGRTLRRKQLPAAIQSVKGECAQAKAEIHAHDRQCRTVHRAAAESLGEGWVEYLEGLLALLHYSGHAEADLRDARGHLANVFSVVTADGRVSQSERDRLVRAATELYSALFKVHNQGSQVELPPTVAERLGIEKWSDVLPTEFGLNPPSAGNIADWMKIIDSWYEGLIGPVGALEGTTLEALLEAEARVARGYAGEEKAEPAPRVARVPSRYTTRVTGSERPRQSRLGWWDRFVTADGIGPTMARLAVAGGIITFVVGFGGSVSDATIVVYNGLNRPLKVTLGASVVDVGPAGTAELSVAPTDALPVTARTREGKVIESFQADASKELFTYVYNVASASPLIEWTAVYGNTNPRPPRSLRIARWQTSSADVLFAEPPKSVSTHGGGATRTVLHGLGAEYPQRAIAEVDDEAARARLVELHARYDSADSTHVVTWLAMANELPVLRSIVAEREAEDPHDVVALRAEQDSAKPAERARICARHRQLGASTPANADLVYIATRCTEDRIQRRERFLSAAREHPDNGWLANAAGMELAEQRRWDEAAQNLRRAMDRLPPVRDNAALTLARMHRLFPQAGVSVSVLARQSTVLAQLVMLESGEDLAREPYRAYSMLAKGEISPAVEQARTDPKVFARVLRLAAASDGAPRALVDQALSLPIEQGLDTSTLWAALALASRERRPLGAFKQLVEKAADRATDALWRLADERTAFDDTAAADKVIETLPLILQAEAYVIGCVLLGDKAPATWRQFVNGLLFASERPYFQRRVPL